MKKNYWKYIIITFLAGVAVFHFGAIAMIWGENYELTSADYYEQEANQEMLRAQLRAGAPYQWRITLEQGRAHLEILDAAGQSLEVSNPRVQLYKPNDASADRELALAASADGGWSVETGALPTGLWRITILAEREGQTLAHKTSASL